MTSKLPCSICSEKAVKKNTERSIYGAELKQNSIYGAELKQNSIHGAELRRQENMMMKDEFYASYLTKKRGNKTMKDEFFCILYEKEDSTSLK